MKRYFAMVMLALGVSSGAWAQGLDDEYVHIYNQIRQADALESSGKSGEALSKYTEAQAALQLFQRVNPTWTPVVISFRLNYLTGQIAALSAKVPGTGAETNLAGGISATNKAEVRLPGGGGAQPVKPAAPADWEQQLTGWRARAGQLQNDLDRLQGEKTLLEAKLKEAFSAQPPAADPAELVKAQGQLKSLQKENELLKVGIEKSKTAPALEAKALEEARQSLVETKLELKTQTDKAEALAKEKQFLESKLALLSPGESNAGALQTTRKALEDASRQLEEQKKLASRLALEKDALQAHVRTLTAATNRPAPAGEPAKPITNYQTVAAGGLSPADAAALRAENALLKKQLASAKTTPATGKTSDLAGQLAEAKAQVAALQSDLEIRQVEKAAMQNRLQQLQSVAPAPAAVATASNQDNASLARIRRLELEREGLEQKLQAANKELTGRKTPAGTARVEELEGQLAALRARLDSFEARQVPYTSEELALLKKPEAKLPEPAAKAGSKSIQELNPAAAKLVVEAKGYFSAGQLDKAEAAYTEAAQQEQKNVSVLANLAAIQVERNRFDAAEATLKQALALNADDSYCLFILGNLKFRQAKYDEALDALSRAAKLDPKNAEVQNFLGLTLSEKGLRLPAETALRKAIELDPSYGSAHNNLAVIYMSQQPPAVALAKLHYQKALSAGAARNPELEKMFEGK